MSVASVCSDHIILYPPRRRLVSTTRGPLRARPGRRPRWSDACQPVAQPGQAEFMTEVCGSARVATSTWRDGGNKHRGCGNTRSAPAARSKLGGFFAWYTFLLWTPPLRSPSVSVCPARLAALVFFSLARNEHVGGEGLLLSLRTRVPPNNKKTRFGCGTPSIQHVYASGKNTKADLAGQRKRTRAEGGGGCKEKKLPNVNRARNRKRHKITHPLDRFSKLRHSTAGRGRLPVPKRAALER